MPTIINAIAAISAHFGSSTDDIERFFCGKAGDIASLF